MTNPHSSPPMASSEPVAANRWRRSLLLVAGVVALVLLAVSISHTSGRGGMPGSFPNAVIPLGTHGTPEDIRIVRASVAPGVVEVEGVRCWPAWQCLNGDCSGRHDGKPFVFPYAETGEVGKDGPWSICVKCRAATDRPRDATNVGVYYTDEAKSEQQRAGD